MIRSTTFLLKGGLNLETPAVDLPAGSAIGGENYTPEDGGYGRVGGYERIDGRRAPSLTHFQRLVVENPAGAFPAGTDVIGAETGAIGRLLLPISADSDRVIVYLRGNKVFGQETLLWSPGEIVLDEDDNPILESTQYLAEAVDALPPNVAESPGDAANWRDLAIEAGRAEIQPVPGSGPVRGVWYFNDSVLAFRDSEDGTFGRMWRTSPTGWESVPLGTMLRFREGVKQIYEGDEIKGKTSGARATVLRVARREGAWDGTATGHLVVKMEEASADFQADEDIEVGAAKVAVASAAQEAITLPPGGIYRFDTYNFVGSTSGLRTYGANGVGPAFEWDGSVFVPIYTGMEDDRPTHVAGHANHLFLAFRNGSLQHSSLGEPLEWNAVTGAAELGMGDEITGLVGEYVGTLVVLMTSRVTVVQGAGTNSWQINRLSSRSGARPLTEQVLDDLIFLDDGGIRSLRATERFGDFEPMALSRNVRRFLAAKNRAGVFPVASLRSRVKAQYRLYWSDGSGLTLFMRPSRDGMVPEIMPTQFPHKFSCAAAAETAAGEEVLLAGEESGFVLKLDSGASFDGEIVQAFVRLPFNFVAGIARNKRFFRFDVFLEAEQSARLGIVSTTSFGGEGGSPPTSADVAFTGKGGFWNEDYWNMFVWSAGVEPRGTAYIDSYGENVSVVIASQLLNDPPHVLRAASIFFSPRGVVR